MTHPLPHRPPSRQVLETALLRIATHWGLTGTNAADYATLGPIESIAHELAHALDLGPNFEDILQSMADDESNSHEGTALRIEVGALSGLGIRLSMRRLRASANWDGVTGIPSLTQLQAPLTPHERCCVGRFMTMVTHEIEFMDQRSSHSSPAGHQDTLGVSTSVQHGLRHMQRLMHEPDRALLSDGELADLEAAQTWIDHVTAESTPSTELLRRPVDELDLSVRAKSCLHRAKIFSLGDLVRRTALDVRHLSGSGKHIAQYIQQALTKFGLSLAESSLSS